MENIAQLKDDPRFKRMVRQRLQVSVGLSVILLLLDAGFFVGAAYFPHLLGLPSMANASLGIWLGISFIVLSMVFSAIYTWWANAKLDVLKQDLLADLDL